MPMSSLAGITLPVVELLSLQPGVTPTGEVIGARKDQNNVTLDGVDINDNQTGIENTADNDTDRRPSVACHNRNR